MRKNIVIILAGIILPIILQSGSKPPYPGSISSKKENCTSYNATYTFTNIHAWGDQLINTTAIHSLSEFLSMGCSVNVTVKSVRTCDYSWSHTYNSADQKIFGSTVHEIKLPNSFDYTITVKIESSCVYDNYLGKSVKLVWTKTVNSSENNNSTELGYPTKADCASTRTSSGRSVVVSDYQSSGRVASSINREMMLQEAIY